MTYRVLIVDDSKLARMAVAKVLRTLHPDWIRQEASNAEEALVLLKAEAPDFVLLDYNMPGKDGLTLATEVNQMYPQINVAVISANRQVEVVQRAHAAKAAFLPKPLTEIALQEFLDAAVNRRREGGK